jgi:hypothetical protein
LPGEFSRHCVGEHGKFTHMLEVFRYPVGVLVRCLTKFGRRHEIEETRNVSS